jgi:hypothetical protein
VVEVQVELAARVPAYGTRATGLGDQRRPNPAMTPRHRFGRTAAAAVAHPVAVSAENVLGLSVAMTRAKDGHDIG